MGIDFTLSPEQRELQSQARTVAASVLAGMAEQLDAIDDPAQAFYSQRDAFAKFAGAGFTTKSVIPAEDGGLGLGTLELAIATEGAVTVTLAGGAAPYPCAARPPTWSAAASWKVSGGEAVSLLSPGSVQPASHTGILLARAHSRSQPGPEPGGQMTEEEPPASSLDIAYKGI